MDHFNTLLAIVQNQNVPVSYGDYTVYFGRDQEIQLAKNKSELSSLAGLAHEYGHHLSQMNGHWNKNGLRRAIIKENHNVWYLSPKERLIVFLEEVRAWKLGAIELKQIGFDKWKSYYFTAFYCLMTYALTFIEPLIILLLGIATFSFIYEVLDIYDVLSLNTILIDIGFSIWVFLFFCTISIFSHDGRYNSKSE